MSNKTLETTFLVLAAVLMGVVAIFLWFENYEGIFIAAALSSASYFLSYRYQVKERLDERESERIKRELDGINLDKDILPENKSLFDIEEIDSEIQKEEVLKK